MATYRSRSRNKSDSRYRSTVRNVAGVLMTESITSTATQAEAMTDFVTADWARLRRQGFYPPPDVAKARTLSSAVRLNSEYKRYNLQRFIPPVNTLTYQSVRIEEPLGTLVFNVPPTMPWLTVDGNVTQILHNIWGSAFPPTPNPQPVTVANLKKEAKSRVLTQCADTSYAFGEPLAEVRETLRFIRSPLSSMRRLSKSFYSDVVKRQKLSPIRQAKNVASAWAEYRFAFSPLLRTVDDAISASADYFYKKTEERYVRFSVSLSSNAQLLATGSTTKKFPYSGYTALSWRIDSTFLRAIENQVSVGIKVLHEDNGSLASLAGLRGRDVPLIIWQTLPLSFLFDRLYDVSSWLGAASNFFSSNVSFIGGWESSRVTDRSTRQYTYIGHPTFPTINTVVPGYAKPWVTENFTFSRDIWVPQLADSRPPALAGRLVSSLTSTADLTAVIIGRMSSATRKRSK